MENRFYVTLPSNVSSMKYFPDNLTTNYITKLAQRLQLNGKWEVGLTELSYTYSWFNFPANELIELVTVDISKKEPVPGTPYEDLFLRETITPELFYTFEDNNIYLSQLSGKEKLLVDKKTLIKRHKTKYGNVKKGLYTTINKLLDDIKTTIALLGDKFPKENLVLPSIANQKGRLKLVHGTSNGLPIFLHLSDRLWLILGFDPQKIKAIIDTHMNESLQILLKGGIIPPAADMLKWNFISELPYDLSAGVQSIFIYTNIVKPTFVGDSFSKLLRVCEAPSIDQFGKQITLQYTNPYYLPLCENEIELIEIDIKDDTGENIPFEYGRVIVTLEFRKLL